jgi:hypothetical protein
MIILSHLTISIAILITLLFMPNYLSSFPFFLGPPGMRTWIKAGNECGSGSETPCTQFPSYIQYRGKIFHIAPRQTDWLLGEVDF